MVNTSSCEPKEPFVKLGTGEAPVLNYNLPQKSTFSVYGRFPADIPASYFKSHTLTIPENNWWDTIKLTPEKEIKADVLNVLEYNTGITDVLKHTNLGNMATTPLRATSNTAITSPNVRLGDNTRSMRVTAQPAEINNTVLKSADTITSAITSGLMPYTEKTFSGKTLLKFRPSPKKPTPRIVAVEEYVIASYLGDYGAGKTVKTFSLLPGEKTSITIRSYEDKESTKASSENILDSFSESSADEFENTLQSETGQADSETNTNSVSNTTGVSLSFPIQAVQIGVENETTVSHESTESRSSYSKNISNAMDKHVNATSSMREVEVNVTSTESVSSGEENVIVRELDNINRSRVLNFVFRQLQQKYTTITYLKDVRFIYTNGYPEDTQIIDITTLEGFLKSTIKKAHVKEVLSKLLKSYCAVYNYNDERKSFIEQVTEDFGDCPFAEPGEKIKYYRKRKDLVDNYEAISVNGVILNVETYTLRTSSLVADSLLGQGEALDCYNISLQSAAVTSANLNNAKTEKALDILDNVSDADNKPTAYKTIFSPCCDEESSETSSG